MESQSDDNTFRNVFNPVISQKDRILHGKSPLISQSHRG